MTTHAELVASPLVAAHAPLLAQATATVGDRQVRHLARVLTARAVTAAAG